MPEDQIILIEGTRNGEQFACPAVTCTVPMLEGSNALTFWAISTYGDSSRMGTLTVLQDTQAPQISAGISGTMGDNNWFVSDAVLSVAYSDAVPGSGISSTSALINGTLTDVSTPVTLPEGVYTIQLDVRDGAGLTAQVIQTAWVDTTAPALSANQPPPESGVYMNGNVAFTGTTSDVTSGVNRIEVAPDGVNWAPATLNPDGSWNLNWDSSVKPDDTYTPRVASTDNAGNRTEISLQPITLDNSAPAMSLTSSWYIWETGHASVRDTRSGIERIELSVRDEQNRWPATGWQFETDHLEYDINWNRQFEDGTWAPTGSYQVLLQAWDRLGNERYITGRIYIPGAGETPVITSQGIVSAGVMEETPQPTLEGTPAVILPKVEPLTPSPEASKTPASLSFSSVPVVPITSSTDSSTTPPIVDSNLLWGASAAAAALAATAYALSRKEEKEAERKRQEEQSLAEANAKVGASEATKTANYIAKRTLEDKLGIPITSDIVACSAGLKGLYQNIVNTILGNPTEEIDEDLLSEIGNDLTRYFNDQPIENGGQTAPASVSWSEFVSTPVGPTLDDVPAAVDYSNLVSLFNQGEAGSNADYDEYQAYHDKMDNVEEQTEIVSVPRAKNLFTNIATLISNGWTSVTSFVTNFGKSDKSVIQQGNTILVPDYLKNISESSTNTGKSVFTPDEELQATIDDSIQRQVNEWNSREKPSVYTAPEDVPGMMPKGPVLGGMEHYEINIDPVINVPLIPDLSEDDKNHINFILHEAKAILLLDDRDSPEEILVDTGVDASTDMVLDKLTLNYIKNIETKWEFKIIGPMLSGFGYDWLSDSYNIVGPLVKSIPMDKYLRAGARAIDNLSGGALFAISTVISVLPNYFRNRYGGASNERIIGDLIIDAGGCVVTELLSIIPAAPFFLIFGPIGYAIAKTLFEGWFSMAWDSAMNRYKLRGKFENELGN